MQKACTAGFMPIANWDDRPDHEFCPTEEDSYCFYNKAIAMNEMPPSHDTMVARITLEDREKQLVTDVIESLSNDELLIKCQPGQTRTNMSHSR